MGWFAALGRLFRGFRAAPDPRRLHGPARIQALIPELRAWTADPGAIPRQWDRWELPLLEALPDCPPDLKPTLAAALDACAGACRQRDTAKRIITLRNSLLP